jgi:Viral BACON domain
MPTGTFTMSGNAASFTALQGGIVPANQSFDITITGTGAAVLGAAYTGGQTQPPWLTINITGSGTHFQLVVGVTPGAIAPGSYTSTFSVGTADASGNILAHQDFTVSFAENAHLTATANAATATMIFGDSTTTQAVPISVTAPNRQWTASSDSPWLRIATAPQSGSTTVSATVDDTGLMPGTYQGTIQILSNVESDDSASIVVSLTVTPASLTVAEASYTFGGNDGRASLTPEPMTLSLSTGQAVYPYTITITTDSGGQWLSANPSAGSVGSAGTAASLSVSSAGLVGGTYTGHVHVAATVNGVAFAQDRLVTFNLEANRLVVTAAGVGLSNVAGRAVLSRTVQVLSALGRTNTPWTAASDSSWLTVTPSGVTGGNLVLTANPAGLPLDATQFANVTIKSSDTSVENQPSIRVGFYASSTAPVTGSLNVAANRLATSPVEPLVAVSTGGANIGIYNVYSEALVRTLPNVVATSDGMTFSEDGKTLFVYDTTNFRVVEVDAVTGAQQRTFDSTAVSGSSVGTAIAVLHPNGLATLITPAARAYDLASGVELPATLLEGPLNGILGIASSPDQSLLATQDGITASLVRSALASGPLIIQVNPVSVTTAQGRSGEACFSANGDRIYTASGFPYSFPATSIATGQVIQTLAGTNYPDAMQCVWNGIVIGGADAYNSADDIFIYYGPSGASLAQTSSNGTITGAGKRDLLNRGMAVSADGTILISAWNTSGDFLMGVYFQTLPLP